jgi:hypothetical protein
VFLKFQKYERFSWSPQLDGLVLLADALPDEDHQSDLQEVYNHETEYPETVHRLYSCPDLVRRIGFAPNPDLREDEDEIEDHEDDQSAHHLPKIRSTSLSTRRSLRCCQTK